MWRYVIIGLTILQAAGCAMHSAPGDESLTAYESTFQKHLARAHSGDAESQNAVGYMFFHGEGIPMDRERAEVWFARAASQGNARAQRNLTLLASSGPGTQMRYQANIIKRSETEHFAPGEVLYLKFCSGCHGVNGIAAYENSPSFALSERLEKSDVVLLQSIEDGIKEMPGWGGKLPRAQLLEVLAFVRRLPLRYEAGIAEPLRETPDYYYLFGPMELRARQGLQ